MSYFSQFLGLPRQVYILCLVRWISGMGSLVFTFSSLILTGMVGLTTKQAGIVAMLYATANVVGAIVGGIAKFVTPLCRREIILDKGLLLKGLGILYRRNVTEHTS